MSRWIIASALSLAWLLPAQAVEFIYLDKTYRDINTALFDVIKRGRSNDALALLQQGANIEARDRFGNTALLLAASTARSGLVDSLIEMGAKLDHRNLIGSTAILRAAVADRGRNVAQLLEAGADFTLANNKGVTPLIATAYNGDSESFGALLERGADPTAVDNSGKSALVYAVAKGFTDIASVLLVRGIDIDQRYGNDLTALMWAAGYSNDVPPADAERMIQLLLHHDATLDLQDNRGWSALMIAADMGHNGVVAQLIEAGADVHLVARDGRNAAQLARAGRHDESLALLNAAGSR